MVNVGVVILHYLNIDETKKCVSSYIKLDKNDINPIIVIVDNGSNNGTCEILEQIYGAEDNIFVLRLDSNEGFARGNNAGLKFLQNRSNLDFVVYSNSDIEFLDNNFYHWLVSDYNKYGYSVLGPDIYSVNNNFHQSPCQNIDSDKLKKFISKYPIRLFEFHVLNFLQTHKFFSFIYSILRKIYKSKVDNYKNEDFKKIIENNVTLHGALFIFSKDFFEKYPDGICSETFLYFEENILKCYCDRYNLKMVYDGTYTVNHMQAASTSLVHSKKYEREIFRLKEMRKSADILWDNLRG